MAVKQQRAHNKHCKICWVSSEHHPKKHHTAKHYWNRSCISWCNLIPAAAGRSQVIRSDKTQTRRKCERARCCDCLLKESAPTPFQNFVTTLIEGALKAWKQLNEGPKKITSKALKIWGKYHIPDMKHDMEAPTVSGCGIESGAVVTMVLTFEGGQSTTTKDARGDGE